MCVQSRATGRVRPRDLRADQQPFETRNSPWDPEDGGAPTRGTVAHKQKA
jgi:hypothetical protein